MKTDEIRKRYLDFFEQRGHRRVAGDSLIPTGDPTLLFTGAGMNQFKEEFLGHVGDYRRATTCQKCLRTGDIDNVGRTPFHFTFFEMLGNFSFGDYFKREAILWAWEFLLEEMRLDPAVLQVSVYEEDEEAYRIWEQEVGVPRERIWRFGEDENFWPANAPSRGPNGICGPCSEIFYDHGGGCGKPDCSPACQCRRFTEIWNLVFTQFDRRDGGHLDPLPQKNIDTGMGLERMAAVMQGVRTGFDIDIMSPLVQAVAEATDHRYEPAGADADARRMKRVADHVRCVTLAMADGALPDRYGRGYVIRRLIRRAALDGRHLGVAEPFLFGLLDPVVESMGKVYPEVRERRSTIEKLLQGEEARFAEALDNSKGIREFDEALDEAAEGGKKLEGDRVFYFTDTHGIPLEYIEEQLAARGVSYDREGFDAAMNRRREESRAGSKMSSATMIFKGVALGPDDLAALRERGVTTEFMGYRPVDEVEATVLAIIGPDGLQDEAEEGSKVSVVFDRTSFYAEKGGQVGDTGRLVGPDGLEAEVVETFYDHEFHVHAAKVTAGTLRVSGQVQARLDVPRRMDVMRNHTGTHLLHWALREVVGEHCRQSGSEVAPERLRFDFTHSAALSPDEIRRVEDLVNEKVFAAEPVEAAETTVGAAREAGAMALFGEKYGDVVRMLSVGDFSKELCGGTHLENTAQVGLLKIVGEESVAAGVRRITAVTGRWAAARVREEEDVLEQAAAAVKAHPGALPQRIESMQKEIKNLKQELQKARSLASRGGAGADPFSDVQDAGGVPLVAAELPGADQAALREAVDVGRKKLGSAVLVLASRDEGKVILVVGLTRDLIDRGLHAGNIVKELAPIIGGGGGGRPDMAQAGGKRPEGLDELLERAPEVVAAQAS